MHSCMRLKGLVKADMVAVICTEEGVRVGSVRLNRGNFHAEPGLRAVLSGSLGSEKGARAWALVYFREAISRGWFCVHPSHPARQRALLLLAVTAAMQPDDQSGSPTMGVCRYRAASWILPRRDRLPCLSPTLGPHDEDTACWERTRRRRAASWYDVWG